jgi:peroxiredoxin Q/BCP
MTHTPSRAVRLAAGALIASALAGALPAAAQAPKPGSAAFAPDTGKAAPDFALAGATRYGLLKAPVHLSDFRGQTVVLAFFPKARTKG